VKRDCTRLIKISCFPWIVLTLIAIKLVSRCYKIKLIYIQTSRIGNSIIQFICAKYYKDKVEKKTKYFFVLEKALAANHAWEKIIRRNLNIAPEWFNLVYWCAQKLNLDNNLVVNPMNIFTSGSYTKVNLSQLLTIEESNYCETLFSSIFLQKNRPFILLLVRDDQYLSKTFPDRDWSYHDYRNSNISDFDQSINYLVSKGFNVVRAGNLTQKKSQYESEHYFDYSFSKKNELLDLWMYLNCHAIITTGTGPDMLSAASGKPTLFINCLPVKSFHFYFNSLWCPKKLYDSSKSNLLSIENYIKADHKTLSQNPENNLRHESLSCDEILEVVKEFVELKLVKRPLTIEEKLAQSHFYDLYESTYPGVINLSVSKSIISLFWYKNLTKRDTAL